MSRLEIVDQGVIFRNPLPGHVVVNAFFPFVHVLPDGEWLCALRTGGALYSRDGTIELFRSVDSGQSWQREGSPLAAHRRGPHYNDRDAALTTLADGSLVLRISRVRHNDPAQLIFNSETGGMMPREVCFLRSSDGGRTWTEPLVAEITQPFPPGIEPAASGAMIELPDGTWFQAFETWKSYDNAGAYDLNTYGLFSTDGGRRWSDRVTIASGGSRDRSYSHGRAIRLASGALYMVLWSADAQLTRFFELHASRSTDASGRKWTEPEPLGIPGQTNWPVELEEGRIALVYSHREPTDLPGIKVTVSQDGGRTWDADGPVTVWDAYGKEALAAPRTDRYPSSHDVIGYGAPQMTRLAADELLASFWCTQGPDTHCRWCRLRWSG